MCKSSLSFRHSGIHFGCFWYFKNPRNDTEHFHHIYFWTGLLAVENRNEKKFRWRFSGIISLYQNRHTKVFFFICFTLRGATKSLYYWRSSHNYKDITSHCITLTFQNPPTNYPSVTACDCERSEAVHTNDYIYTNYVKLVSLRIFSR